MTDYHKLSKLELIKELHHQQSEQGTDNDAQKTNSLRHDLEVHQIELEMQNRELRDKQQELELARDKYADLYEFAPVGYLTLDDKGIIREINLTAASQLEHHRSQLIGKPFTAFLINGSSTDFFHALRAVLSGNEEQSLELPLKTRDQTDIHVRLHMVPCKTVKGGVRVALINITGQKQAEAEARETRESLLQAGRVNLLGELSSGIAHEVSQPITAIAIYAQMLRDLAGSEQLDNSTLIEIAEQIAAQSARAGLILDRVRSFVRREVPSRIHQNILDVITDAVQFVKPSMLQHGATVEVLQHGTVVDVQIDRVQIIQVLVNLLQNAIESMNETPAGERKILVDVSMADQDYVEVAIRDNGIGIPSNMREQLFMPFYTTRKEGLGLGLSLSHSLIQAHGGQMWAVANTPRGAVFHFRLPTLDNRDGTSVS